MIGENNNERYGGVMRHIRKKAILAGGLGAFIMTAAGCYYGGYGNYNAYSNQIKTTAAADTLEDFQITDFVAKDGTYQYKSLGWLSSYKDLEELIGMSVGTTTAFTEGETMGDINYSIKLFDYVSVGMQPVFDAEGGLTTLTVYFEETYTAEQLDTLFDKVLEASRKAFGDEDKYQEAEQDAGNGTIYNTTAAFWYRDTDKYGDYTQNSFQIGKLDTGNGTSAVVIGANIFDPTAIEEESESENNEASSAIDESKENIKETESAEKTAESQE